MPDDREELDRTKAVRMAWRYWLLRFIPLYVGSQAAIYWFGFNAVFPVIVGLLSLTLLYQRFVKKRTWYSIVWGDT